MFNFFKRLDTLEAEIAKMAIVLDSINTRLGLLGRNTGIISSVKPITFLDGYAGESGSMLDRILRVEHETLNTNGQKGSLLERLDRIEAILGGNTTENVVPVVKVKSWDFDKETAKSVAKAKKAKAKIFKN